jgi:DNA-binding response OmpR family regulator
MRPTFESRLTHGPVPLSSVLLAAARDEDARVIIAAALTSAGYRLRLTDSGDDLVREAMADDVSLAIVDMDLRCSDGRNAIETVKSRYTLRSIPILAFGGAPAAVAEADARKLGADGFLGSHSNLKNFLDVVAAMHKTGQQRRAALSVR